MKIGVIGLGNLGTAIAYVAAKNGHHVIGWEYDAKVIEDIAQHKNDRYLPHVILPNSVSASADINTVFREVELVFITLPSRYFYAVLSNYAAQADITIPLVNMAKGIDSVSGKTAFQLLEELFPANPKAMLAGPSLANEFAHGVLTAVVAATVDKMLFKKIAQVLDNERFSVSYSEDVIGVELGGILKNIYALGLGLFSAREDVGLNFNGAYLTQALKEIQSYGMVKGADIKSFVSLSGLGDLIATSLSVESHNYKLGKWLASGLTLKEAEVKMGSLPEGFNTLNCVVNDAKENNIKMPLANLILALVMKKITAADFFTQFSLVLREID